MLNPRGGGLACPVPNALQAPGCRARRADALPCECPAPVAADMPAEPVADVPLADWGALFSAVTERLQRLTGSADAPPTPAAGPGSGAPLQDCVQALQYLHLKLDGLLQGDAQRRAELAATQAQLAHARAELARRQIGRRHAVPADLPEALARLPDRSHFQARLDSSLGRVDGTETALAVLCLDLDGFDRINGLHGRTTGDAALCIVAQRLLRALRADDTVCRLGGDRFACLVVVPASREQISQLACKLFDAVAAPLQVGTQSLSVQPSIGVAVYPADGTCGAALLQRADAAMCRARRHQQGYAFFEGRSDL